ncbi:MAG: hypothetical protein ACK5MN_00475 [Lachnospiraceae bacterium]
MILFVGEEDKGYFAREVAGMKQIEYKSVAAQSRIAFHMNEVLSEHPKYIIFDIEQYIDDAETLSSEIIRIQRAKKAEVIIYAPGFNKEQAVIEALYKKGIIFFIFSTNMGLAKQELERALEGYYVEPEEEIIRRDPMSYRDTVKIGVAGARDRIGTTTQALQLVKHLQTLGYRTCYVEVNHTEYVKQHEQLVECIHEPELGRVTYADIDMYYKQDNLLEILNQEYDYYVFDYGTYTGQDFNKTSFLEKDLRIFVMGMKASEAQASTAVISNEYYKDVEYVFSFVSEAEREDVLEVMEDRADRTGFAVYVPDPFEYMPNDRLYAQLLPAIKKKKVKAKDKRNVAESVMRIFKRRQQI